MAVNMEHDGAGLPMARVCGRGIAPAYGPVRPGCADQRQRPGRLGSCARGRAIRDVRQACFRNMLIRMPVNLPVIAFRCGVSLLLAAAALAASVIAGLAVGPAASASASARPARIADSGTAQVGKRIPVRIKMKVRLSRTETRALAAILSMTAGSRASSRSGGSVRPDYGPYSVSPAPAAAGSTGYRVDKRRPGRCDSRRLGRTLG